MHGSVDVDNIIESPGLVAWMETGRGPAGACSAEKWYDLLVYIMR